MADITTMVKSVRNAAAPGRPSLVAGIYILKMVSASDTLRVPTLLSRSATADQSSVRVLSPATGVTVTAGALNTDTHEHTLTVAGSSADAEVVLLTLHADGRVNGA